MSDPLNFAPVIRRQREFFQSGATRSWEFRRVQLRKLSLALEAHEADLQQSLEADLHKSPLQSYLTESGLVLSEARHALRQLRSWMKPRRRQTSWLAWPSRAHLQPEPYGVVLILGPWNYPVQLLLLPLVGAIAAGNCAVLKPSEFAPQTSAALARLIRSNFPPEYLAVVEGDQHAAEALLQEKFDYLFFTGSTRVGQAVMTAAARHLTPLTLELGGKCPCLVCADAPLEITARRIAWGKFMNAGQTCVAPDFVLVDRRRKADLLDALARAITSFYGPDPRQCAEYGRIINRQHWDRLSRYLDRGRIVHGGRSDANDRYLEPTLITDVPMDAPVMQEEIFGPILPVIEFDTMDSAIEQLRPRPTPLAFYLFTRDEAIQRQVLSAVRSGGVCLNDTVTHMVGRALPFGGLGESGHGSYHGRASFDCFTHWRSVLRRSFLVDPPLRYPPPLVSLATLKRAYHFLLGR